MAIKIDKEFRNLIPCLTKEERASLKFSIETEGQREPIIVWKGKNIIVDGHNRYDILQNINVNIKKIDMHFEDREEVMVWMIDNQKGRRNLSKSDMLKLGMKRAELLEEKAKEKQQEYHGNQYESAPFQESEKVQPINTTKEMADYAGVSIDTASKYKKVMNEAPEQIRQEVNAGTKTINRAYQEIKKPDTVPTDSDFNHGESSAKKIIVYAESVLRHLSDEDKNNADSVIRQWINNEE
ncbi:ParB/RepB/Spo0J family partition protein [Oceanispirochaeta sp.]|jgi:hypothetical protein|uniref:ParB/RepB/Spo0J family partition protein n=1 Tax=Oceanispirochaeta sp. TaxID=2035350 RepID=UPI00261A61EB|nr:ParB/RepB/Spo0J family partition protein [Oceanispirochaeta sp.]MDA3958384.1 ParB/RepB/Spo0J family partition protein [Oceanispirochaeta sp.]